MDTFLIIAGAAAAGAVFEWFADTGGVKEAASAAPKKAKVFRIELTDDERSALACLAREYVTSTRRHPLAPRLGPVKSGLVKLVIGAEGPESLRGRRSTARDGAG